MLQHVLFVDTAWIVLGFLISARGRQSCPQTFPKCICLLLRSLIAGRRVSWGHERRRRTTTFAKTSLSIMCKGALKCYICLLLPFWRLRDKWWRRRLPRTSCLPKSICYLHGLTSLIGIGIGIRIRLARHWVVWVHLTTGRTAPFCHHLRSTTRIIGKI